METLETTKLDRQFYRHDVFFALKVSTLLATELFAVF